MTQSNPLELAKQGDPQAIAALMNRTLQPKGMNATASIEGDRMEVVLESDQVPNQQVLANFVQNGLNTLGLRTIRLVKVVGKQTHANSPAWEQEIPLTSNLAPAPAAPAAPPPPPPPPRPIAAPPLPPPSADDLPMPMPLTPHRASLPIPPLQPQSPLPPQTTENADDMSSPPDDGITSPPMPSTELPPDLSDNLITAPPDFYFDNSADIVDFPEESDTYEASDDIYDESDLSGRDVNGGGDLESTVDQDISADAEPTDWQGDLVDDEVFGSGIGLTGMPEVEELEALADQELGPVKPIMSVTPVPTPSPNLMSDLEALPAKEPTRLPIGGIVAVILTLGLSFGIIAYSLYRMLSGADPQPIESPVLSPSANQSVSSAPTPVVSPSVDVNAYAAAIDIGTGAAALSQSAQSIDDWRLVTAQWQQAIALLQSVPADSPDYANAQAQLPEYQSNLAIAQQKSDQPVGSQIAPTSTTVIAGGVVCPEVAPTEAAPAVELTSVRLEAPDAAGADVLVGCVTNHSGQAIASISITYQVAATPAANPSPPDANASPQDPSASPQDPSASPTPAPPATTTELSFDNLQPGRTVPFRSVGTIPADVTSLTIASITLTSSGGGEPQQLQSGLQVTR